jgi:hypothetical protein
MRQSIKFALLSRDLPVLLQRARDIIASDEMCKLEDVRPSLSCPGSTSKSFYDQPTFATPSMREMAAREQLHDFLQHLGIKDGSVSDSPHSASKEMAQRVRTGLVHLDKRMWDMR